MHTPLANDQRCPHRKKTSWSVFRDLRGGSGGHHGRPVPGGRVALARWPHAGWCPQHRWGYWIGLLPHMRRRGGHPLLGAWSVPDGRRLRVPGRRLGALWGSYMQPVCDLPDLLVPSSACPREHTKWNGLPGAAVCWMSEGTAVLPWQLGKWAMLRCPLRNNRRAYFTVAVGAACRLWSRFLFSFTHRCFVSVPLQWAALQVRWPSRHGPWPQPSRELDGLAA